MNDKDAAVTAPTTIRAEDQPAHTDDAPQKNTEPEAEFRLSLDNFEGPFDLLLSLIARRKLDITDVALAEVTDEFIQYINALYAQGTPNALDQASDFLVTAATLLDLKAARLLPRGNVENEEDVALLEARDLLFARLLQYRAYREVSAILDQKYRTEADRFARTVALDTQFKKVLPELVFNVGVEEFAQIAAGALNTSHLNEETKSAPAVQMEHLRAPLTSIADEEEAVLKLLDDKAEQLFSELIAGTGELEVAVVRFLAVLELYRLGTINVVQEQPLGAVTVSVRAIEHIEGADDE